MTKVTKVEKAPKKPTKAEEKAARLVRKAEGKLAWEDAVARSAAKRKPKAKSAKR